MIFSELYSAYYNTVAAILKSALEHPITKGELRKIIENKAFSESALTIEPSLANESWQLLCSDGTTPLKHTPTMPLTLLQKRWLKAISLDVRIRLFDFDIPWLDDTEPLFAPEDVYVFDRYADGDPFEDEAYIKNFRMILDAIKNRRPLCIDVRNRKGSKTHLAALPEYLEYSEKDDKFRLITSGCRYANVVNLGRIISCKPFNGSCISIGKKAVVKADRHITAILYDRRNALERALLHFAHFEKEAIRLDEGHYKIKINYSKDDETEMVIRVLSFGPFLKVSEPENFVNLIKKRLEIQKSCGLD